MIEEDTLRRLMAEAASAAPESAGMPEALSDALAPKPARTSPRRFAALRVMATAAAVVVILGMGTALLGGGVSDKGASIRDTPRDVSPSQPNSQLNRSASSLENERLVDTAKVIKTGSVDLETAEGAFGQTVDRIIAMTVGLGGFVADSKVSESDDAPYGSITVRVPSGSFEQLLTDVRKLGRVKSVTSKGTDVTARFSDLNARAAALLATRDRLLQVLSEARTIGDILAVQDRITGIQTQIEQIQGQQRLLDDQTGFGTLAANVTEPGSRRPGVEQGTGLAAAWSEARRRFGDGMEGIVAWSGSASVVLIVGIALAGLGRLAWLGIRRRLV